MLVENVLAPATSPVLWPVLGHLSSLVQILLVPHVALLIIYLTSGAGRHHSDTPWLA